MKIYIPINWGWYAAVFVIFGPMILVWAMEPNWVARMIGMGIFFLLPPLVCLWYALGPKRNLLDIGNRKNIWPDYVVKKIGKDGVDVATRVLTFIAGSVLIFLLVVPFIQDVLLITKQLAPIERIAYVAHTRSLTGNISEEVILDSYPNPAKADDLTAWYFTPRHIMTGNTYKFLYIPNSRIILEAIPVESNRDRDN